nr:Unknown Function [uncultured bacterium]
MTQVSDGGRVVAQHIAAAYRDNPNVQAVMVGGSVARGHADHYSDLELGVFWSQPPSEAERKTAVTHVGGALWSFTSYQTDPETVVTEQYGLDTLVINGHTYHGSLMISTNHLTVRALERYFTDVQEYHDTNLDKQMLLAAIQDGQALTGNALLQTWQARATIYPDRLAIKMVQENLWCGPWFVPQAYVERDDLVVLYQHFIWMQQSILKILAGLNRVYYRSVEYKWMDGVIDRFTFAPPELSVRMKQVFREDPATGVRHMLELVRETIALVEHHLPDVNRIAMIAAHPEITTAWARKRWEVSAPYTLLTGIGAAINTMNGAG